MPLPRKVAAAVAAMLLRLLPARPITQDDLARADFSTHPGGKALRFTERLRAALRRRWLRLSRPRNS